MKKRKKWIIIVIIGICILVSIIRSIKYNFLQEDLLFFQFIYPTGKKQLETEKNIEKENIKENNNVKIEKVVSKNEIQLKVAYRKTNFEAINLLQTINNKTLVNEKIAPGTSGNFEIKIYANENLQYEIQFESENVKPSNLQFYTKDSIQKYNSLEALANTLKGNILSGEEKTIPIYWEWNYETSKEGNIQDTNEAKKIREYNFKIYVKGY